MNNLSDFFANQEGSMKILVNKISVFFAVLVISAVTFFVSPANTNAQTQLTGLENQVRKQLVKLPWVGVFDNLAFKVNGDAVTLYGQVVRPTTRTDAERRVAKIEGVRNVINNIEVLPLSRFDDEIRYRTVNGISNYGSLYRYFLGANPSLRVIVNRGNITLEGMVANRTDANLAYIAARQVPGAFSVTNNLQVERDTRKAR
jgi:hyperosmotically inducible protein